MTNETNTNDSCQVENCLAKIRGAGDLVDCLTPEQAKLCNYSLSFGSVYFCKHPRRDEIIKNTRKLQSEKISLPNISQSDNQE
jgi:hypothetical protein